MAGSNSRLGGNLFPTVALIDKTKNKLDASMMKKYERALQIQVDKDFFPVWGFSANIQVKAEASADDWQIIFLDDAERANNLGYHDITSRGQPVSKVFVESIQRVNEEISVTASHELLEMLVDPGAQLWAQSDDGLLYAYEVCDAVEDTFYEIEIDPKTKETVRVCNFVFPAFFEPWNEKGPFDKEEKLTRPFETRRNGYQIVSNGADVGEIFGSIRKRWDFTEIEDRTMHRSEYRKWRFYAGAAQRAAGPVQPTPPWQPSLSWGGAGGAQYWGPMQLWTYAGAPIHPIPPWQPPPPWRGATAGPTQPMPAWEPPPTWGGIGGGGQNWGPAQQWANAGVPIQPTPAWQPPPPWRGATAGPIQPTPAWEPPPTWGGFGGGGQNWGPAQQWANAGVPIQPTPAWQPPPPWRGATAGPIQPTPAWEPPPTWGGFGGGGQNWGPAQQWASAGSPIQPTPAWQQPPHWRTQV